MLMKIRTKFLRLNDLILITNNILYLVHMMFDEV